MANAADEFRAEAKRQARLARCVEQIEKLKERVRRAKADKPASLLAEACSPPTVAAEQAASSPPPPPSVSHTGAPQNMTSLLLEAHSRWDWKSIVTELLQSWPRVERAQLDTAPSR